MWKFCTPSSSLMSVAVLRLHIWQQYSISRSTIIRKSRHRIRFSGRKRVKYPSHLLFTLDNHRSYLSFENASGSILSIMLNWQYNSHQAQWHGPMSWIHTHKNKQTYRHTYHVTGEKRIPPVQLPGTRVGCSRAGIAFPPVRVVVFRISCTPTMDGPISSAELIDRKCGSISDTPWYNLLLLVTICFLGLNLPYK